MEKNKQLSITIKSLSHDGRGIAHNNGKTIFLDNALPTEEVEFAYTRRRSNFDEAKTVTILKQSPHRVDPKCPHFNICGGCNLQHLQYDQQLTHKIQIIKEQFQHIANIDTINILPAITGPIWEYRGRARLTVKYVHKKQKVLVGFHETNGRYVAQIDACPILHPTVNNKIIALQELITQLSIFDKIPQIEMACGDNGTILVLRHLQNFTNQDLELLKKFSITHNLYIYTQNKGLETIQPLLNTQHIQYLTYKIPQDIEMRFTPIDFTQINQIINQQLVAYILKIINLKSDEKVLDLFCGIGNFTLPLARKCKQIIGVEGNKQAVMRAQQNAKHNNIKNAEFYSADLTKELPNQEWNKQQYDKILLDPPRTGAQEICAQIKRFDAKKIIYISCNPATLARDTKELIANGYHLDTVTPVDMFPHTKHIETVATFILKGHT